MYDCLLLPIECLKIVDRLCHVGIHVHIGVCANAVVIVVVSVGQNPLLVMVNKCHICPWGWYVYALLSCTC